MDRLLAAIQELRALQAELALKQREFHAAISIEADDATIRHLQADLAELFERSDAAFAHLHAHLGRINRRRTAGNDGTLLE